MQDIGGSVSQLPVPSSAMLTVWRLSGQELAARSAEEFTDAASLKKHLYDLYGFPIYLQQLVHRDRLLSDEARLDGAMDLQLVLKSVLGLSHGFKALAARQLATAAAGGHVHRVRCLLEAGAEKDWDRTGGMNALMLASRSGHMEVAGLLVGAAADVECKDSSGMTALMLASKSGHLEVARLLVQAGADKDCSGDSRRTALMLASHSGHMEVARLLVGAGADKDCKDRGGMTALMLASSSGHVEITRLLTEAGAEKDCKDRCGTTA